MSSQQVLNLVFAQNGYLTLSQYVDIYDNSPTLQCIFFDEYAEYKFEFVFTDKEESILCNVVIDEDIDKLIG